MINHVKTLQSINVKIVIALFALFNAMIFIESQKIQSNFNEYYFNKNIYLKINQILS